MFLRSSWAPSSPHSALVAPIQASPALLPPHLGLDRLMVSKAGNKLPGMAATITSHVTRAALEGLAM